jgi:RNase P/RNase MRP subunit p29
LNHDRREENPEGLKAQKRTDIGYRYEAVTESKNLVVVKTARREILVMNQDCISHGSKL